MRALLKNCSKPQVPEDMHIEFLPLPSHLPTALLSYFFSLLQQNTELGKPQTLNCVAAQKKIDGEVNKLTVQL